MSEATGSGGKLRVKSGLGFVQALRPALYGLLALSALFTFFAGGDVFGTRLPGWTQVAAPALFGIFLVVFAVYRVALIRGGRYPAAVGLFQIGLGALIWVLLLPGTRSRISESGQSDDVAALMTASDPRVRALAAEVAGTRADGSRYAEALIDRLSDGDVRVRETSRRSLVRIIGGDPAEGKEGDAAIREYRDVARQRGWILPPP